jgi:hypothetical protein
MWAFNRLSGAGKSARTRAPPAAGLLLALLPPPDKIDGKALQPWNGCKALPEPLSRVSARDNLLRLYA